MHHSLSLTWHSSKTQRSKILTKSHQYSTVIKKNKIAPKSMYHPIDLKNSTGKSYQVPEMNVVRGYFVNKPGFGAMHISGQALEL